MFHFCPLVFSVYTISKENKSSDGEGNDCPGYRICREENVGIFRSTWCGSKRILNVFNKNLSILHSAFKWASKLREKALKKLVNGWKFGPNHRLIVFYNKVDVLELKRLRSAGR